MPSTNPRSSELCVAQLQALGAQIRAQRKALGVSATVIAEAAGVSRVTLHRIEKGGYLKVHLDFNWYPKFYIS